MFTQTREFVTHAPCRLGAPRLGPPALLLTERGARARLGSGRPMGGQAGRGEGERGPRVAESRDHGAGSIAKRTMNCF